MLAAMSRSCPGAFLLIDETYREATYGDARAAGTFAGLSPRLLTFGPEAVDRFHRRLVEQRTLVALGPWFHDSARVFRLGLAHEPPGELEHALGIIGAAVAAG
jgi:hypothetical protein